MTPSHLTTILEKVHGIKIESGLSDEDLIALVRITNTHYNQVYEGEGRGMEKPDALKERLHELYAEIVRRIEERPNDPSQSGLILSLYEWIYNRSDWSGREKERMEMFKESTQTLLIENQKSAFLTENQCLAHEISIYALRTKEERKAFEKRMYETFQAWMKSHEWGNGWHGCSVAESLRRLQIRLNTTAFSVTRDWDYEFTDVMESIITELHPETLTNEELSLYYEVAIGMEEWYLPLKNDVTTTTNAIIETLQHRIAVHPNLQLYSHVVDWFAWQELLSKEDSITI